MRLPVRFPKKLPIDGSGTRSKNPVPPLSYDEALQYALKLLSKRPRSKAHLTTLLVRKGCESSEIARLLVRLEELHLLNDKAFAEQLADEMKRLRPSGRRRIWNTLRQRKVTAEVASQVVATISAEEEADAAKEIARRYEDRWKNLPAEKRKKRLYDLLVRRGFDYEVCREVLESMV